MKIDRVILCLNNNPIYTGFWNPFSRVWKEKYGILPTLIFVGTEEEIEENNLSTEYGEIVRLEPVPEVIVDPNLDWSTTWGLFYGPTLFPEDVCLISGIDQLPLSSKVFSFLREHTTPAITDDHYVVGLSDAKPQYTPNYPSSWHIAKGKNFKKLFDIEDEWEIEVKKVFSFKDKYSDRLPANFWALDEEHSSAILENYRKSSNSPVPLIFLEMFSNYWLPNRIDRSGMLQYDKEILKRGGYSEIHAPRPFEDYKNYLNQLIDDLLEGEET
jgi:hypothetical protein